MGTQARGGWQGLLAVAEAYIKMALDPRGGSPAPVRRGAEYCPLGAASDNPTDVLPKR